MQAYVSHLQHRAVIRVAGPDWAPFLKGLCTAHIDDLAAESSAGAFDRLHYGAFLRPQGKMYADCLARAVAIDEVRLDVPLSARDELIAKLNMYRLRAKVTIEALDTPVFVTFGGELSNGFLRDPRSDVTGAMFGMSYGDRAASAKPEAWTVFRMALGVAEPGVDFGADELYAIDANLDLLGAIDFHKGCYVGQELTSRMKRRGQIKNRILPFRYQNHPPAKGSEVLNGDLRAGNVLSAEEGCGLALMRLDRLDGDLRDEYGPLDVYVPDWIGQSLVTPPAA